MTDFFTAFLGSCVVISLLIVVLFVFKKGFARWITPRWQYNMGLALLLALALPFIPVNFLPLSFFTSSNFSQADPGPWRQMISQNGAFSSGNWMQDFTITINRPDSTILLQILFCLWLAGVTFYLLFLFVGYRKWRKIKSEFTPVSSPEILLAWQECLWQCKIKKTIPLLASAEVSSPMLAGLWRPYVVTPQSYKDYSAEMWRYVFLHELSHYKQKDLWFNAASCLLRALYWFHPLVGLFLREMDTDREIRCDDAVLDLLGGSHRLSYGQTLLSFAQNKPVYSFSMEMGGRKKQLVKRIEKIALLQKKSLYLKMSSIAFFLLAFILIISQLPGLSGQAYAASVFKAKEAMTMQPEDLSVYFEGFDGAFVLYDLESDIFTVYNEKKSIQRVSPQSTYKIYSSLIALQEGVIAADNSYMPWDGTIHSFETWNQDQTLETAMANSATWYFQKLDRQSGRDKIQYYFDAMAYGNQLIQGDIGAYWMASSLKISPMEQVLLLKQLYLNQLEFDSAHMETVKKAILLEQKEGFALYGKTGSSKVNGGRQSGWFIGYVEKEGRCYIFAVYLEDRLAASGSKAAEITLKILEDKNLYEIQ